MRPKLCLAMIVLAAALLSSGCSLREYVLVSAVREQAEFIPDAAHLGGWDLQKITDRVYTFRWHWDRSLVVLTSEGFVVTDPFNAEAATILKGALEKLAPGKPVRLMIYTHYHLDHVVGGGALAPREVIAHAKCPQYWADLSDTPGVKDILAPTTLIDGDRDLTIGGVAIRLLYLGRTHTDTLYAIYLPGEKVLHTADLAFIRTLFPIGGPDMYEPGILKQLDRLAALDFVDYVPSHFGYGKKSDFLESVEFHRTVHRLALEAIAKYGVPSSADDYEQAFHFMYDPMKEKYGAYHGFDQQVLFLIGRAFSGVLLGY